MADAKVENKAKTNTAPKTRKAAPKRKTAAKKTPAKKATAKKTTSRAKTSAQKPAAKRDLRAVAVETGRNALRAGLGVYGKAYDQMQEQFEALQKQVDEAQNRLDGRRKQAEELYESLVKRGAIVEQDALKAFEDLELDALTDRSKLEEQMTKAKARFEALRAKLKKAA
jgi:predicted nuclease with TOPRIM domain